MKAVLSPNGKNGEAAQMLENISTNQEIRDTSEIAGMVSGQCPNMASHTRCKRSDAKNIVRVVRFTPSLPECVPSAVCGWLLGGLGSWC